MQWQDIRRHYPDQWLLIEAIKAHSENDRRILDDIAILEAFEDSDAAMKSYAGLHREASIPTERSSTSANGAGWVSAVCEISLAGRPPFVRARDAVELPMGPMSVKSSIAS